jgi:hypothetical protein
MIADVTMAEGFDASFVRKASTGGNVLYAASSTARAAWGTIHGIITKSLLVYQVSPIGAWAENSVRRPGSKKAASTDGSSNPTKF